MPSTLTCGFKSIQLSSVKLSFASVLFMFLIYLFVIPLSLFVPDSTATISEHPCAPSNSDCNWMSKVVYQFVFVYELLCDEGHFHGDLVAVIRLSRVAYWCTVHTDLWSEPPTFLPPTEAALCGGSCPDE